MRNILLIARREYLEQIRGKAFRITTIMIPVVFAGIMAVMILPSKYWTTQKDIVVAAQNPALAARLQQQLSADKDAKLTVGVLVPATEADRAKLHAEMDAKKIDGFLWVAAGADGKDDVTYVSRSAGDFTTDDRLDNDVNHALVERRLVTKGIPAAEVGPLTHRVDITTMVYRNGKEEPSSALSTLFFGEAMAFLLTFTVVMYGMNVGRSVIQEKTSRIFEVMLSTVKSTDMLAGKLIGIGAVGLTQILIWIVLGAVLLSSAFVEKWLSGEAKPQVSGVEILLLCIYFLLGYALYSALFAGLAATCDTEQELQQYAPLAAVPVWLSFGMFIYILGNPNSIWSVLISMFPPCAPITMAFRFSAQFPPLWQIALSLALLAVSIYIVLWLSSRVYRVGILMYGKRATLPEMIRWLRYS
ncbi:MAG TPA: ABC transporter permease [Acidobacteriaceae bacterium]|nr:ABC transporter permease [Acidobacteriaceae bacterium]